MTFSVFINTLLGLHKKEIEINNLKQAISEEALQTSKAIRKMNQVIVKTRSYYIFQAMGVISETK